MSIVARADAPRRRNCTPPPAALDAEQLRPFVRPDTGIRYEEAARVISAGSPDMLDVFDGVQTVRMGGW